MSLWQRFKGVFISSEPVRIHPDLISSVDVKITFNVRAKAKDLTEVLNMLTELHGYIEARPNVKNTRMERLVELDGTIYPYYGEVFKEADNGQG